MHGPPSGWRSFSGQRGEERVASEIPKMGTCPRCGQVGFYYIFDEAPVCYDQLVAGVFPDVWAVD